MRKPVLVFLSLATLALGASTAFAATTLSADTDIALPPSGAMYTLSSGGTFDTLTVSSSTMTFVMSNGESVTITAPSNVKLTNDGGFSYACATHSTLTLTATTNITVNVTPSGTCTASSSPAASPASSSSSSSGSSSATGAILPCYNEQNPLPGATTTIPIAMPSTGTSTPTCPATASSTPVKTRLTQNQISAILALITSFGADQSTITSVRAALAGTPAPVPTAIVGTSTVSFTRDLHLGSQGADVEALQHYLNTHSAPVAANGPGSPGNETDWFGSLTKKALAAFQKHAGIAPAAGYFGPLTRAYVDKHP